MLCLSQVEKSSVGGSMREDGGGRMKENLEIVRRHVIMCLNVFIQENFKYARKFQQ